MSGAVLVGISGDAVYQRFSTPLTVDPADRFALWWDWYETTSAISSHTEPLGDVPQDFSATAETLVQGPLRVSHTNFPFDSGLMGRRPVANNRDTVRLILFLDLPVYVNFTGKRSHAVDGSLYVVRGARYAGEWVAPAGFRTVEFALDRSHLVITDAALDALVHSGDLSSNPAATALVIPVLRGLAQGMSALEYARGDLLSVALSVFEFLAAGVTSPGIRSLNARTGDDRDTVDAIAERRRSRAREYIAANLTTFSLDADTVAAAIGVSRRTLYTLFDGEDGGIASYIRVRRVERAHGLLTRDAPPLLSLEEIAAAAGFPSVQTMSRALRARYGTSARGIRSDRDRL